ncbi:PAS domain-containing protein [Pseudomonas sp. RAC1]|uniref:hybrid sensor histidine kinase/response regulator n=1 Tax=Pseudomonas sp. RAC1 TaxID=3064900 RepID=UPI00271F046F|nr:PAS domain-containing protein [Pseudomonas sp. RAC1]MDV9034290.1 PAS domain-containing protein [Pseudomonas sp. RAC1]
MDSNVPPSPSTGDEPASVLERLQLALDSGAISGTWVWDIPNNSITADLEFSRSFGLPAERCKAGIPIEEAFGSIHPDDLDQVAEEIQRTLQRGGAFRSEYRARRDDGQYRWIEASGHVELDADGAPIRFPGVLIDIESRRAAEAERDRMSALLRTFAAAVPGVVYAKDLQGRMLVANQGTTDLIGKPPEFYLGKTDLEFLEDKEQARQVMATDQRIMREGKAQQVEERVDLADGTATIWLSHKAPLFDDHGKVIGLIGSSIDVTAKQAAEQALRELNRTLEARISEAVAQSEAVQAALSQAQKMEAVGQLTVGIAHDFNNLLAGITGSLDLIRLRLNQGRTADLERYVSVAHTAAQRAAALTHRLLAFSRKQTLLPVPTDMNALIGGIEELIQRTVGPTVNVTVDLSPTLKTCLVDPVQFENALLNLCINARDALPGSGNLSIRTAARTLLGAQDGGDSLPAGNYLSIVVEDDGIGMDAATLAKAFDPFFTTKPVGQGSGLGLSMIYGFAKQSGGQISLESEPGQGTRACLLLPVHDTQPLAAGEPLPSLALPDGEASKNILVVDDEASVRAFVTETLSALGHVVIEAADSKAGLQLLQSNIPIDLLVTDIGLPGGMDGHCMALESRKYRPGLPILFMTGYAHPELLESSPLRSHCPVLSKPFSLEALVQQVHALSYTASS